MITAKDQQVLQDNIEAMAGIEALLRAIGEDPRREGVLDTPRRVVKAFREMTAGTHVDVAAILERQFESAGYDGVVAVTGIDFVSLCEHHLLPFSGTCSVAYLPGNGRVVGLSKIPRVVDAYARRLQLQEQMTVQIAKAFEDHLKPKGVGVLVEATHSCMSCRGVRKPNARMITSEMLGAFRRDCAARDEVLRLFRMGG